MRAFAPSRRGDLRACADMSDWRRPRERSLEWPVRRARLYEGVVQTDSLEQERPVAVELAAASAAPVSRRQNKVSDGGRCRGCAVTRCFAFSEAGCRVRRRVRLSQFGPSLSARRMRRVPWYRASGLRELKGARRRGPRTRRGGDVDRPSLLHRSRARTLVDHRCFTDLVRGRS